MKANIWTRNESNNNKEIARAAPNAEPAETPRIYVSTSGFLKTACNDAPETESAIPPNTAAIILGNLISKIITSYALGHDFLV